MVHPPHIGSQRGALYFDTRCGVRLRIVSRCIWHLCAVCLIIVGCAASSFSPVSADPWLDRVERNLRRIEQASKYTEPLGAGSRAAAKQHNACIHKNDERACEKIIWRSPELLPVRDWAVGTAHIKRGELREKRGNVNGAIEDYRDALGYHQFPNLSARIKRLELRQKRLAERAKMDSESKATDGGQAPESKNREKQTVDGGSHPIVVVAGWAASVADDDRALEPAAAPAAPSPAPSRPSGVAADGTSAASVGNESLKRDVRRGFRAASGFVPGGKVALRQIASPPEAAIPTRSVRVERGPSSDKFTPAHHGNSRFPVDDGARTKLTRSQNRETSKLTTSALPDGLTGNARQRSHDKNWVIMMTVLALVLGSTLMAVLRSGLRWDAIFATQSARKPVLSVDDLEAIIKQRTAETTAPATGTLAARTPDVLVSSNNPVPGPPDTDEEGALVEALVVAPVDLDDDPDACGDTHAVGSAAEAEQDTSTATIGGDVPLRISAPSDEGLHPLDPSLIRRVSYGAASLIVAGGDESWRNAIVDKLDESRKPELLSRSWLWDAAEPEAAGVLNPFAMLSMTDDPLVARNQFNAAFELYTSIFESIFGTHFVHAQKVMLRHLATLLQGLPDPSLQVLYTCLENRHTLEPLREALDNIESVQTRLFFATVFSSDEFAQQANYMRQRLAVVLANEHVVHLCCNSPKTDLFSELQDDGRWVYLPFDAPGMIGLHGAVMLRSLMAVMAMRNYRSDKTSGEDEITVSLFVPDLETRLGGTPADVEFFAGQLKRAGYVVL